MKMCIRLIIAILVMLAGTPAFAQTFPNKPVHFICPLPPGGDVDIVTRILSNKLSELWGQPVIVDNRVGAGGTIGAAAAAKAAPDGYTIFMGGVGNTVTAPFLYKNLPYDGVRAFAPVTLVGATPMVLAVNPSLPFKTIQEFVAYAKANPGKLTYASAGVGSTIQLPMELLRLQAGVDIVHVAYKGAAPALTEVLGGQVASMFAGLPALQAHIKSGKLRALAVTASKRSAELPNVPTIAESGFPGFEVMFWFAVFAPAGTPQAVVTKLQADVVKALRTPDVQRRLIEEGLEISASSPDQLAEYVKAETTKWSKVIREAKITLE
jgi:tripartite-type tricarboxylate transporter receptor subunit TctC